MSVSQMALRALAMWPLAVQVCATGVPMMESAEGLMLIQTQAAMQGQKPVQELSVVSVLVTSGKSYPVMPPASGMVAFSDRNYRITDLGDFTQDKGFFYVEQANDDQTRTDSQFSLTVHHPTAVYLVYYAENEKRQMLKRPWLLEDVWDIDSESTRPEWDDQRHPLGEIRKKVFPAGTIEIKANNAAGDGIPGGLPLVFFQPMRESAGSVESALAAQGVSAVAPSGNRSAVDDAEASGDASGYGSADTSADRASPTASWDGSAVVGNGAVSGGVGDDVNIYVDGSVYGGVGIVGGSVGGVSAAIVNPQADDSVPESPSPVFWDGANPAEPSLKAAGADAEDNFEKMPRPVVVSAARRAGTLGAEMMEN